MMWLLHGARLVRLPFVAALILGGCAQPVRGDGKYLPNPHFTPGQTDPALTESVLRDPSFRTEEVRDVTRDMRIQVFAEYGMDWNVVDHRKYELDHLIPLGVGGASAERNLWPEPLHVDVHGQDLGAKTKDRLEDKVIKLFREGRLSLQTAQSEFTTDWTKSYESLVGPLPPYRNGAQ